MSCDTLMHTPQVSCCIIIRLCFEPALVVTARLCYSGFSVKPAECDWLLIAYDQVNDSCFIKLLFVCYNRQGPSPQINIGGVG
jgi:hypothetical protein